MSRVLNNDGANYLFATPPSISGEAPEFTAGVWVKPASVGAAWPHRVWLSLDHASTDKRIQGRDSEATLFTFGATTVQWYAGRIIPQGVWSLILLRRKADGTGGHIYNAYIDGAWSDPVPDASAASLLLDASLVYGVRNIADPVDPANGKIAHAFTFGRALTDSEVASLAAGSNPNSLDAEGRLAYYPLDDAALENEWGADYPTMSVAGTVAVDEADNPPVDVLVVPPSLTITNAGDITPGTTLTATASNFSAAPTTISLSDGASPALTPALTATASGDDYDLSALIADFKAQADAAGEGVAVQGLRTGTITATVE